MAALGLGLFASAQDQTITGNLTLQGGELIFKNNNAIENWRVSGNVNDFSIYNTMGLPLSPFIIDGKASSETLFVGGRGGYPRVGIGGSRFRDASRTIFDQIPRFRLESTAGTQERHWEMMVYEKQFMLYDAGDDNGAPASHPFVVDPGTPDYALYLSKTGRIGMGTLTPSQKLSVAGNIEVGAGAALSVISLRSTAGTNRIGNDATGLFAASDIAGKRMRFFTNNGAGIQERLSIAANGNVGVGTASPTAKLQVVNAKCDGNTWINASSRTLKQDIEPITSAQARDTVRALQPVGYRYKNELDERYVGFIAEDIPELVATNDRKGLAPMDIVGVLTKVVQDQSVQLDEQRKLMNEQQATLATLMQRLEELERNANGATSK